MVKMSALISVIGLQELTRRANELIVTEYRALEIYTVLIIEYLVIIMIIGQGVRWLERKMGSDDSGSSKVVNLAKCVSSASCVWHNRLFQG